MGILKHGKTKTATYQVWADMRRRCTNKRCRSYPRYGGRGITVCQRWDSFESFVEDMGEKPPNKTIERNDNDGNYEPGNCHWASYDEQNRNNSRNIVITHGDATMCATDWAAKIGIKPNTLLKRLNSGLSAERALTFRVPT